MSSLSLVCPTDLLCHQCEPSAIHLCVWLRDIRQGWRRAAADCAEELWSEAWDYRQVCAVFHTSSLKLQLPSYVDSFSWTESWVWSDQFTRPPPAMATLAERNSPGKNQSRWCFESGGQAHSLWDLFNWQKDSILNKIIRFFFHPLNAV